MKKWHLKAALQGGMSLFPFRQSMNYLFQKHVSHSLEDNRSNFEARLDVARQHLAFYTRHAGHLPESILELGSGWQPIIPVAFWLCGVQGPLTSIDIQNLRRDKQLLNTLRSFIEMAPNELLERLPLLRNDRLTRLREKVERMDGAGAQQFLADAGVRFIVGDARQTAFQAEHFDHIISNYTFEHIPGPILGEILIEFRRLLAQDGLMTHLIDMSDHYSHFDSSITPYNFLRYSQSQWIWFNNALLYQNRLRVSDYRALHMTAGFVIVEEELGTNRMQDLDTIPLAPEFAGYSRCDLAATHAWVVTRPNVELPRR